MGPTLMQGQSWTGREISMARRISVGTTVTELSIGFPPAAHPGSTLRCTASTVHQTGPAQALGPWPSDPTARSSEPRREGDTLAVTLKFAPARGRKFRSTNLAAEPTGLSPLAEWFWIRQAISMAPPTWGVPSGMALSLKKRSP